MLKVTLSAKPCRADVDIVRAALPPVLTLANCGEAESKKSGPAVPAVTVNGRAFVGVVPLTLTTTFETPVPIPVGTGTMMVVAFQLIGVRGMPPKLTVLAP